MHTPFDGAFPSNDDYTIRLQSPADPSMEIRFPIIICHSCFFWSATFAIHWAAIVKSMIPVVSFQSKRLSTHSLLYSSEIELIERFAMHGTQKTGESQILWFVLSVTTHISPMSQHRKFRNYLIFVSRLSPLWEITLIYLIASIRPRFGIHSCHLDNNLDAQKSLGTHFRVREWLTCGWFYQSSPWISIKAFAIGLWNRAVTLFELEPQ